MKNINRVVNILVLLMLPAIVAAETGKAPDPASAERGAKLYKKYCVSCHGVKAIGEQIPPPMLRSPDYFPAPPLDDTAHAWHHSDENLVKTILEGSPRTKRMPAWKVTMTKKQVEDVVAYIKSLWSKRSLDCQGPKHMSCM